ncbi:hypothetical protein HPB48_023034 [Haemaphysalis longicornis]|uniref:Uncharacterized protein n=1 Tax=Haemaphysalis longicornis TaxID=44386 RepID=A0A9J6FAK7_HAELO|nr:hypothetical protein HPB48_023034 [Haemaphysalis longicornis]
MQCFPNSLADGIVVELEYVARCLAVGDSFSGSAHTSELAESCGDHIYAVQNALSESSAQYTSRASLRRTLPWPTHHASKQPRSPRSFPPPKALDTSADVWQSWTTWKQEFELFAAATCLNQQPKEVQAATFLMVIGEDARKTYSTFVFEEGEEKSDIAVLKKI